MRFENSPSRFKSTGVPWVPPDRREPPVASRYAHIVVPTCLNPDDRGALLLGMEMAALHQAALTVLHVTAQAEREPAGFGLDALTLLHRALDPMPCHVSSPDEADCGEPARREVVKFLTRVVDERLRDRVSLRVECRAGDVASRITEFADQAPADLVIVSAGRSRWWLPILPAHVRRLLHRARQQVILVRPEATARRRRCERRSAPVKR
jgi:nucleotide-binding universal stress UspA family protein